MKEKPIYKLSEMTLYFLKLGTWGFGGPVALVGYMHTDLVEKKGWVTEEEYKEGLALAQLSPGPLAAQLGIYMGFVHYGILGATLIGLAFVLPSFIIVVLLGMAYKLYSGLPGIQAVFYGVSAAVIGIIAISAYKLTIKSVSSLDLAAIRSKWLLWVLYLLGVVITVITKREDILLFVGCGLIYMVVKSPPKWGKRPIAAPSVLLSGVGFWHYDGKTLQEIGWFFLKAGAFVFGSGLAIVPFLHGGVVQEFSWLTEHEFLDAVAVAMVTPGSGSHHCRIYRLPRRWFSRSVCRRFSHLLTLLSIFTVALAPSFKKIAKNTSIKAFVDGITAVVIGALVGSVIIIALLAIVDIPTALIAIFSILALIYIKKIKEPQLILLLAIIGILIKTVL